MGLLTSQMVHEVSVLRLPGKLMSGQMKQKESGAKPVPNRNRAIAKNNGEYLVTKRAPSTSRDL